MKSMKKLFAAVLSLTLALCLISSASACTALYVGSALTDDGATIWARSEDLSNSMNKLYNVAPAGFHKAGEVYDGCYGFSWTFTHDSYGYTAFSDDNGEGVENVCPDCGGTHPHTPYQAAGTNEKGLSVSATETIRGSQAVRAVDPMEDAGIEEAEIVTVLLSEAASAKEALALYFSILDGPGATGGSGILIGDNEESWYIENVTGHQYIAVKLSDSMVFSQPNMVIIGLIDLDDTDNVMASENLIAVAKEAESYVGDEEANTINYVLSYAGSTSANARMINALNFFDSETYAGATAETIDPAASYLISNVDAAGNIVAMHTGISLSKPFSIVDAQNYYHCDSIASTGNMETHIFQIYAEDSITDTIEWVSMDHGKTSVFVPYYPMLTKDVDASYKVSTPKTTFAAEIPEGAVGYASTATQRDAEGNRITVEGFKVYPENWADSMYWSFDALSNIVLTAELSEEQIAAVYDALGAKQAEINAAFDAAKADLAADADAATAFSMDYAAQAHQLAVELVNGLVAD